MIALGRDECKYKIVAIDLSEVENLASGKVSLAHPYQMAIPDDELESLVKQLADWGLDAIECFYPKYTQEQQDFYLRLTEKYRLHRTGGSDFHGEKVKPDVMLAKLDLELEWLLENG